MLKTILGWLAAIAAFASAALWFWASNVPLDPRQFAVYGGLPTPAQQQFARQVRLNSHAALATGVSALFQAASLLL